ncbi:hypothetical protein [Collinsella sp. zg1085]|uniref:cyanophycin synthetase family protein n=1 Tax=Collinsella sp. zg1085 TaxID=2844380 RepID=UPI00209A728C|nr:hypothetical protein [Collinsella sp. zg1085]
MAGLFNIMKISIGPRKLTARVLINPGMPTRTSEDIEATARVYYLAPAIAEHSCLGDTGEHFQDCMADTELAHLLEHLSVELMNQTGLAGQVVSGRTSPVVADERLFDIGLSCPDDVLTVGALSSAVFMMEWAFLHGEAPAPDVPKTVEALTNLVRSLRGENSSDTSSDTDEAQSERESNEPVQDESAAQTDGTSVAQLEDAHMAGLAAAEYDEQALDAAEPVVAQLDEQALDAAVPATPEFHDGEENL